VGNFHQIAQDLIITLRQAQSLEQVVTIFNICCSAINVVKITANDWRVGSYRFMIGLTVNNQHHAQMLLEAAAAGITIAPSVVEQIEYEPARSILVSEHKWPNEQQLIPCYAPDFIFNKMAMSTFFGDMQKLVSCGFIHGYAAEWCRSWRVDPASHKIYLADWDSLYRFDNQSEGQEFLAKISELLTN